MASGKRASMREGPLAALFRKTETDGLEDDAAAPRAAARAEAAAAPGARAPAPPAPAPQPRSRACRRRRSACATRSPPTCPRT